MASMLIKHLTLPSSLLVFVFFAFTVADAMSIKDMYAFCKDTDDVNFCLKYIGTDIRILAARDLHDVLVIAISQCQIQLTKATKQINKVRQKFSGPIGTRRLYFCGKHYSLASAFFQKAYEEAQEEGLESIAQLSAVDGSHYMFKCEDEWKNNGPIQKSPFTFYYTNVVELLSIIQVIIEKMYG
ncbi:putative pectinesterase inhibitor domain-containing protein [Arabidopsis thaliana]|uniref:Invertase/pectin methylesterase inhibitor domain superfamily n=3 Tax=Arabidopsis TaxID=3701 RepID=A0A8T2FE07_ARASU|nr:Invertase/pectin methylesterase inhibitor domain superfamily [Arabidopsis thaliana x Arabidopsis arenosa]KAG7634555.1 Invertase/pectin methylesterase inhibitor domain superfamily [Arabidopsis suecica]OAP02342.1 hypothetical protein AXX17_AT3G50300 [Arabidopsis thaliana]OAP03575.1 hypothetical protein AXX17_AT3G50310 [Arabidopsis thaliana]CAD5325925.1 unnamed protein product [Arabidopsis thaliana]